MKQVRAQKRLSIGGWAVSPDELRLSKDGIEHTLEAKVMDVLLALAEKPGVVIMREALIDQVWSSEFGGDESLTRAISLLRKALGDQRGNYEFIRTVPRKGYQLIAPVEFAPDDEQALTPAVEAAPKPAARQEIGAAQPIIKKGSRRNQIALITAIMVLLAALINFGSSLIFPGTNEPPLVIIMDSAHPARIYDDATRESGGTNADILSDIFADLPIRSQKELISPQWHRYESILKFEPDLIIIHYSGFKQEDARGPRPKLKLLIEYFEGTDTEFLIYSRASESWLSDKMEWVLEENFAENPSLRERIAIFPLVEYGEPNWMDQNTSQGMKLKVKEMLALDN